MSGSSGVRGDRGDTGGGGEDPCLKVRRGPINSPKANVLAPLNVGDVLAVDVDASGSRPVLVVADAAGNIAGSLTFIGYLDIIDCILSRGFSYKATITNISGGIYEVRVDPV